MKCEEVLISTTGNRWQHCRVE